MSEEIKQIWLWIKSSYCIKAINGKLGQTNWSLKQTWGLTAVGVALFPGAGDLIAIFVYAPALTGAAMTLGWFEVTFIGTARNIRAWKYEENSSSDKKTEADKTQD